MAFGCRTSSPSSPATAPISPPPIPARSPSSTATSPRSAAPPPSSSSSAWAKAPASRRSGFHFRRISSSGGRARDRAEGSSAFVAASLSFRHSRESGNPGLRGGSNPSAHGKNARPAHDGAADGAPAAEALVDLGRHRRLLLERSLGLDLRVGDVADGEPGRRIGAHLLDDHSHHGISHLRQIAQTPQLVVVVQVSKPKKSVVT